MNFSFSHLTGITHICVYEHIRVTFYLLSQTLHQLSAKGEIFKFLVISRNSYKRLVADVRCIQGKDIISKFRELKYSTVNATMDRHHKLRCRNSFKYHKTDTRCALN